MPMLMARNTTIAAAKYRPMIGSRRNIATDNPVSSTSAGPSSTTTVSANESYAHMPRVTLRTVEPAKLLACQSLEKRWMRRKPSLTMWCMTSEAKYIQMRR